MDGEGGRRGGWGRKGVGEGWGKANTLWSSVGFVSNHYKL